MTHPRPLREEEMEIEQYKSQMMPSAEEMKRKLDDANKYTNRGCFAGASQPPQTIIDRLLFLEDRNKHRDAERHQLAGVLQSLDERIKRIEALLGI